MFLRRVNQLAFGFLARAGSRGGIAFWSGAVARGAAVFFFFGFSPPASATGSTATSAPSRARGSRVNQLALGFLARAGSRGGIAFWSGAVARGAAVFFFFGFSPPASATGSTATSAPSRATPVRPMGSAALADRVTGPRRFSRARGAAAALPSGPGRWRAAPPFFLFRFFAAGFSYGVDRDERPIARTRV